VSNAGQPSVAELARSAPLAPPPPASRRATAAWRGAGFLLLWLLLIRSAKPADLVVGLLACGAATWASLRLLPPAAGSVRVGRLLSLLPHLLWESSAAGVDVARRAFHPRAPTRPGFVACPLSLPPGFARDSFATITSLLPGSVASGDDDAGVVYHCLDVSHPVVEHLWREERLLAKALIAGRRDG
jgi:multicomponent Na+:H+ antiporter subunit E